MQINDVIQISLVGSYKGAAQCRNVFFYQCMQDDFEIEDIVQAFIDKFLGGSFLGLFTSDITFSSIEAVNIFNRDEVYELGIAWQGENSVQDEALPPFATYSVKLTHDKPSQIRSGAKRFSGVPEGQVGDGLFDTGAFNAASVILSSTLATDLIEPIGAILRLARPVVVKRIAEIVDGITQYRLPANFAEAVIGIVIDAILSRAVGTQNSRKFGKGV